MDLFLTAPEANSDNPEGCPGDNRLALSETSVFSNTAFRLSHPKKAGEVITPPCVGPAIGVVYPDTNPVATKQARLIAPAGAAANGP
jgi:hypothetical protein